MTGTLSPVPPVVPVPDAYLELCDRAIEEAEQLAARRRAAADDVGERQAHKASEVIAGHRAAAVDRGVPSRRDGFGFSPTGFVSEREWGDDGRSFVDAVYAMHDYWRRNL